MAKTHGTMDQFEAQVRARITELDPTESVESATNTSSMAAKPYTNLDSIPDELTVTIESSSFDDWRYRNGITDDDIEDDYDYDVYWNRYVTEQECNNAECDNPIMSSSIPYGEYGQMLIDDEEELRYQYDQGELAPSDIVESLGYVAQDDHVYIKDLGNGCNMVFDFTKYDMGDDDDYIQHYFTDETGRVPRGYTITKMYL